MKLNDSVYGEEEINEPVLLELINSKPVQRLKGISQMGLPKDYYHRPVFSRFDHSVGVLILLRRLNANLREQIAGLLHDIGQLLMFNQLPEKSHESILLLMEGTEELETYEAERHVFGFDHMQVGAELIKTWKLAPVLQECVEFHHEPQKAKQFPAEVRSEEHTSELQSH